METAVTAGLGQHESVLLGMEEMTHCGSDTGVRANGLWKNVLGLYLASEIFGGLECLNKSLQKKPQTIAGCTRIHELLSSM